MEDDKKKSKWKTTKKIKMEDDKKNQNGRRQKKIKMEDDQKIKIQASTQPN